MRLMIWSNVKSWEGTKLVGPSDFCVPLTREEAEDPCSHSSGCKLGIAPSSCIAGWFRNPYPSLSRSKSGIGKEGSSTPERSSNGISIPRPNAGAGSCSIDICCKVGAVQGRLGDPGRDSTTRSKSETNASYHSSGWSRREIGEISGKSEKMLGETAAVALCSATVVEVNAGESSGSRNNFSFTADRVSVKEGEEQRVRVASVQGLEKTGGGTKPCALWTVPSNDCRRSVSASICGEGDTVSIVTSDACTLLWCASIGEICWAGLRLSRTDFGYG